MSMRLKHAAILARLGGHQTVAKQLGLRANTVCKWSHRGIPYKYWYRIMELAPGLTVAQLEATKPKGVQARRKHAS